MTFAQPLFLWGLLAALIPLVVHLFDRRRPREVPFAALDFVLRSQRRTASRLRLKRILLYLLRTLLLLAVPLALARPACTEERALAEGRGIAATAIIVDASLSMRWTHPQRLFAAAQEQAKAALRDLRPEEPATMVLCTGQPTVMAPLSFDRARLFDAIENAQPGYELVDVRRCLEMGARALDDSPLGHRRLVLVSALTQNAMPLEAPFPMGASAKGETIKPEFVVRDVAAGLTLDNRSLVDVNVEAAPHMGARAWQFTFTVHNFSAQPAANVELRLEVNGEVVQKGFVDLAPDSTAQKTLSWRFQEGGLLYVTGRLAPDALPEDDALTVALAVPQDLKALIVNGSPSAQKYRDEAFFTEAALASTGSPARAVVRDADAAWKESLSAYHAVLLLNVEAPKPEVADALEHFVAQGGGLFLSMGDRVEPEAWNATMKAVLPGALRVVKTAVEPEQSDAASRAARLTPLATQHAIMAPFNGRAREGLLSTRFYRYTLFDTVNPSTEVLGTLDDGAPVFLASRVGQGRVFVLATTVDRDWSDLPIRTSFLPLMQRIVGWLTASLDQAEHIRVQVGTEVTLHSALGQPRPSRARAPSGAELALEPTAGTTQQVRGGPIVEPGPYEVFDEEGHPLPTSAFSANLNPAASNLSRHTPEAITSWAGEDSVRSFTSAAASISAPLWSWLLGFIAVALLMEGLVLRS